LFSEVPTLSLSKARDPYRHDILRAIEYFKRSKTKEL
jgi:hypothetical protein